MLALVWWWQWNHLGKRNSVLKWNNWGKKKDRGVKEGIATDFNVIRNYVILKCNIWWATKVTVIIFL